MSAFDHPSPRRESPGPASREGELWVCQLGVIAYREALALQERVAELRRAGRLPDTLLLLEHPPVITRGRRTGTGDLPLPEDFYVRQGIELVDVNRGGKLTYHGPGQLVGYPIVRVADVKDHLRKLEAALIGALAQEGIAARSRHQEGPDYTGVWVQDRKIASIGVHVARGVATHGFALNVCNDLEPFSWFVPCGLSQVAVTSLARERTEGVADLTCMRRRVALAVSAAHGLRQRLITPERLRATIYGAPLAVGA